MVKAYRLDHPAAPPLRRLGHGYRFVVRERRLAVRVLPGRRILPGVLGRNRVGRTVVPVPHGYAFISEARARTGIQGPVQLLTEYLQQAQRGRRQDVVKPLALPRFPAEFRSQRAERRPSGGILLEAPLHDGDQAVRQAVEVGPLSGGPGRSGRPGAVWKGG